MKRQAWGINPPANGFMSTSRREYKMTEYNCGYACGFTEPYGFVPEVGCPIHDTAEFAAITDAMIARECERCANLAFDVGYPLADEAEGKFYDGWTASDLVVDASEKIAAAIRNPPPSS